MGQRQGLCRRIPIGSAVGQLTKETNKAKSNTSSFCTSQERDSATHFSTGPGAKSAVHKDSELAAPKDFKTATLNWAVLQRSRVSPRHHHQPRNWHSLPKS